MSPRKLTKRTIDAAQPQRARYILWDTEITGFGLRVQPTGRKTFIVKFRPGGGREARQCKLTIGEYGPLTVDQARLVARRMAGAIAEGRDPSAERQDGRSATRAAREAPTVADLGDEFLADVGARCKPTTAAEYARMWSVNIAPALGALKVGEVTPAPIAKLHRSMHKTRYMANRVLAVLGRFFAFAEELGARPRNNNPAHEVKFYDEDARERRLTDDEITRLGTALERAASNGLPPTTRTRRARTTGETAKHRPASADDPIPANPFAVAAIRFLMLSGWREQEALTLQWDFIDFSRGVATLPDTKTRRSVRQLGDAPLRFLRDLPRYEGSPYVFPGRTPDQPLRGVRRLWDAVREAAGLEGVRLHDLRHTFASVAVDRGDSIAAIGKLLGHADTATTQKYAHVSASPVQRAADGTAAHIAARLGLAFASND